MIHIDTSPVPLVSVMVSAHTLPGKARMVSIMMPSSRAARLVNSLIVCSVLIIFVVMMVNYWLI